MKIYVNLGAIDIHKLLEAQDKLKALESYLDGTTCIRFLNNAQEYFLLTASEMYGPIGISLRFQMSCYEESMEFELIQDKLMEVRALGVVGVTRRSYPIYDYFCIPPVLLRDYKQVCPVRIPTNQ